MHWSALYHTWKQTAKARWVLTAGRYDQGQDLIRRGFVGRTTCVYTLRRKQKKREEREGEKNAKMNPVQ